MTDTMPDRFARYNLIERLNAEGDLREAIRAGDHDATLSQDDRERDDG